MPAFGTGGMILQPASRILESIIFNLAANETSFFQLVSMAEKTGLSLASSCRKPQRQVLSRRGLIY